MFSCFATEWENQEYPRTEKPQVLRVGKRVVEGSNPFGPINSRGYRYLPEIERFLRNKEYV